MKKTLLLIGMLGVSIAGNTKIQPTTKLDVVDTALCTAAAYKQDFKTFTLWSTELNNRYTLIFPQKTKDEIDSYTTERIQDKKRALERKGFSTKPALQKYYQMNCKGYEPKV